MALERGFVNSLYSLYADHIRKCGCFCTICCRAYKEHEISGGQLYPSDWIHAVWYSLSVSTLILPSTIEGIRNPIVILAVDEALKRKSQ
jgi:hypothetical protein